MAERCLWGESGSKYASLPSELDVPINSILVEHDPDGRFLDSEMLLQVIESIMHHTTESQSEDSIDLRNTEVSESELDNSICVILNEILGKCYRKQSSHAVTLDVLSLLGSYRWDEKLLLALSAFATQYGQFWVVMQSKQRNSLAASIALLKRFPFSLNIFKPIFTALTQLFNTMIEVIKSVARFEGLPIDYVELQGDSIAATKKLIYIAAYWVVRSITRCIFLVMNLRTIGDDKDEDPYSVSNAIWEITSLKSKIRSISTRLREQVDVCQKQIEKEMDKKLKNLFEETHVDNQEVLSNLFALKNNFPLKQSSEPAEVGISSLRNKVVILLFSKPELLPIEELLLLVQQTYDHPIRNDLDGGTYAIIWVPISDSSEWKNDEIAIFNILSDSLPWYSIRQPWSLSSSTIKYAKEVWDFIDKPVNVMVVLDSLGKVTNLNAADMLWTWGAKAYPFSTSREKELWEDETWSLKLLLVNIDPLITMWVEESRTLCIYGSSKLDWIRDFTATIRDIQRLVPELDAVYVGKKDENQVNSNLVSVIEKEELSKCLSLTNMHFFWHRLESMKRSKLRLGCTTDTDHILKAIEALQSISEEWVIIGRGCSTNIVLLNGDNWAEFMGRYSSWKNYLSKIGLVNAIRLSLDPPAGDPCSHSRITEYSEGLMEETLVCEKCKHLIKKLIIYDPE